MTKLAGYSRCLSVIELVMPKSRNTALATILAPMVLGTEAAASRPSVVLHLILKLSSERRTIGVPGISTVAENLLFSISQLPVLPSLKDRAIGT